MLLEEVVEVSVVEVSEDENLEMKRMPSWTNLMLRRIALGAGDGDGNDEDEVDFGCADFSEILRSGISWCGQWTLERRNRDASMEECDGIDDSTRVRRHETSRYAYERTESQSYQLIW